MTEKLAPHDWDIAYLCSRREDAWQQVMRTCEDRVSAHITRLCIEHWERLDTQVKVLQQYFGELRVANSPICWNTEPLDILPRSGHKVRVEDRAEGNVA